MVHETESLLFLDWIQKTYAVFFERVLLLGLLGLVLGYLIAAFRYGPLLGGDVTFRIVRTGFLELFQLSPRRITALAWLAIQESIRRRILIAFGIFLLILLFAGWFLDPGSTDPSTLYLSFVLTTTTYLVLLLALFLSAFSLPADIKNHTIYTIVTKPVRSGEIVLGRILGFSAIGTVLVATMGLFSYFFVVRLLNHTHGVEVASLNPVKGDDSGANAGRTTLVQNHRHDLTIDPDGTGITETKQHHWHDVQQTPMTLTVGGTIEVGDKLTCTINDKSVTYAATSTSPSTTAEGFAAAWNASQDPEFSGISAVASGSNVILKGILGDRSPTLSTMKADGSEAHGQTFTSTERENYVLGPPQGMFQARVPVYGKLRFKDRSGNPGKGVNVGNEWTYRSYIEGGSLAAAIWTFDDLRREQFPDGLHLEMTIRVFRTYKGNINKGILGSIVIKNPRTGRSSQIDTFPAKEFEVDERDVPLKLKDSTGKDLDLFDDLVDDGKLEVWVQCLEPAQYFGAAQPDLYLRAHNASFVLNFVKGYVAIWLQMILVTSFGVMFSTFLNGAVAMLATMGMVVMGYCTDFVTKVAEGKIQGGGPVESLIRIITQQNVVTEMDPGLKRDVVQTIDGLFMKTMEAVVHLIPDFKQFINVDYVAHGYDVPLDTILIQVLSSLGYLAVVFVVGYVCLKTREVAK